MHRLAISQHSAEHPTKGQEHLLTGILRPCLPFLPACIQKQALMAQAAVKGMMNGLLQHVLPLCTVSDTDRDDAVQKNSTAACRLEPHLDNAAAMILLTTLGFEPATPDHDAIN